MSDDVDARSRDTREEPSNQGVDAPPGQSRTRRVRESYYQLKAIYVGRDISVPSGTRDVHLTYDGRRYHGALQKNGLASGDEIPQLFEAADLRVGATYELTPAQQDPVGEAVDLTLRVVERPDKATIKAMTAGARAAAGSLSTRDRQIVCLSLTDGPAGTRGGITTASDLLVSALNQLPVEAVDIRACNVLTQTTADWRPSSQEISIHSARFRDLITQNERVAVWVFGHGPVTGNVARELAQEHDLRRAHFLHTAPSQTAAARARPGEGQRAIEKIRDQRQFIEGADIAVFVGNASSDYLPEAPDLATEATKIESFLFPVATVTEPLSRPSLSPVAKIMIAGRLDDGDVKGLGLANDVIHLLSSAHQAGRGRHVQLQVCGADLETEERLFESAPARGCTISAFPFLARSDMSSTMATNSLLLMPSSADALGLVALEALAMGRPALVSSLAGIARHYVDHDAESWVLSVTDPNVWADAAWKLINDADSYERASIKARHLAQQISQDASQRVQEFTQALVKLSSAASRRR